MFYENGYTALYNCDCRDALGFLAREGIRVNTVVTSPPYFAQRDYGVDGQIGLEQSIDAYVSKLVEVFRACREVLRDDGTLWINIGDTYWCGKGAHGFDERNASRQFGVRATDRSPPPGSGIKRKDLLLIPARVALALQADGWYLRSEIIWEKPNFLPSNAKDRPEMSHEKIFMFSKRSRYYYDWNAVKQPCVSNKGGSISPKTKSAQIGTQANSRIYTEANAYKSLNSVWTVATGGGYRCEHAAMYPVRLIEPCILAGCPEGGVVLDPFGGSGTTAVAAHQHGRNTILCELNPDYAAIAAQRLGLKPMQDDLLAA